MEYFLEIITDINKKVNDVVWGPVMLVLLVGTGIYLSFGTGFLQVFKFGHMWKNTIGTLFKKERDSKKTGNVTPFQAVSTALASTVGTGNIVGVATAIVSGGPGAVFWMWVSAFFGMMTKYSEVVLAVYYRQKDSRGVHYGGPMYYIEKGLGLKWLAVVFAALGAFASFGIGNMLQANSISTSLEASFDINPLYTGIVISIVVGLVIMGGITRITKVTEKLVPFMAIFYIIGGLFVLVLNAKTIPHTMALIFEQAFSFKAAGSGIMGYVIAQAMRYGFARGVFSNEAGLGSAPIAHAVSDATNPVKQGLWGIFEVFIDTIIICTLTALVILTSGLTESTDLTGAPLTSAAFSQHLGDFGGMFISLSIILFALSTILGWSYYGERCIKYLVGENKVAGFLYKTAFLLLTIVGSVGGLELLWDIADTLNGAMAIPNLIALMGLSRVVFKLTKKYLQNPDSVELRDDRPRVGRNI